MVVVSGERSELADAREVQGIMLSLRARRWTHWFTGVQQDSMRGRDESRRVQDTESKGQILTPSWCPD
jgi:hypothetical protein